MILNAWRPWRIQPDRSLRRLGWPLILLGAALAAWATWTAGRVNLERPDQLVTRGPYAVSRHPMYVAWTLIYLGVALVLNTVWLLILLPLAAVLIHREAQNEESRLEDAFGESYRTYRQRVRRYL
jgi:protein-S-isoprenylcysteine O-methyltransferase Ste14